MATDMARNLRKRKLVDYCEFNAVETIDDGEEELVPVKVAAHWLQAPPQF
jgi:hypothetical protein